MLYNIVNGVKGDRYGSGFWVVLKNKGEIAYDKRRRHIQSRDISS